ncbi:MAG TPA: M12 family metallopeptidase [Verrucomicrobiae bacterium]|nr:M12 family metallopeptidase [Verrucomicrobiae bacterium]
MKTCSRALLLVLLVCAPSCLTASPASWSADYLSQIIAAAPPGQKTARVGDMEILLSDLTAWRDQLAGAPTRQNTFDGATPSWTGGNVYYTFSTNAGEAVPLFAQKVFHDCAQEWAAVANLHFFPRTTEPNYVLITQQDGLSGGQSTVGMIGGQQMLAIGPTSWNHATVCHELGHTLGLLHEHQRFDRDNYVTILSNNVEAGELGNFVLLPNSRTNGPYDFLSVMHYSRSSFSIDPNNLDTIEPLPAYEQFINIMGEQFDPVLSVLDRAGMAAIYGPPSAPLTSVVTNTQDSGPGSLRAALYYAFDHPGAAIIFNIPASDSGFSNQVFNILPSDRLPSLVHATTLDGATEPLHTNPNGPSILLNGALAQPPEIYASGLRLGGTNCVVRSLIVNGFSTYGIVIDSTDATGNTVAGCYLGADASGLAAVPSGLSPLAIDEGASGNTVGGVTAADRNFIVGSAYQGLVIRDPGTHGNRVFGNYVGLTASGAPLSNAWSGVAIFNGAQSNVIGGAGGARNIVSGNGEPGITVSDPGTTGNIIAGNYIGLDPTGARAVSNAWAGVDFFNGAGGNFVGTPAAPNVISGNGAEGVLTEDPDSDGNVIAWNYIGTDPTGAYAISNGYAGVSVYNGPNSTIIRSNLISGNGAQGIFVDGPASDTQIQANYLGVDATGARAIPNGYAGIEIYNNTQNTLVGGVRASDRNILSGNNAQGILIDYGSSDNFVEGNFIGLDATGTKLIPNQYAGVELYVSGGGNVIGGLIGARNYIGGNNNSGVALDGRSSGNFVQGNSIGVNYTNGAAPNLYQGVSIFGGASSNLIGGATLGAANLIANNPYDGVDIFDAPSVDNTVQGNSIIGNGGGLNLYNGGNESAPSPSLLSAVLTTNLAVFGSLTSQANTVFHLDFYASPPASPQAAVWLGSRDANTDSGGFVTFNISLGAIVPAAQVLTATATDPSGNTSALSSGVTVAAVDSVGDGVTDAWRRAHFGGDGASTNASSCATCDPDQDGFSNRDEFLAGADPNKAASALRLDSLFDTNGLPAVSFLTAPGFVYRLDVRSTLNGGAWTILADQIPGTGNVIQVVDNSAAGGATRFYRLEVLP